MVHDAGVPVKNPAVRHIVPDQTIYYVESTLLRTGSYMAQYHHYAVFKIDKYRDVRLGNVYN